MELTIINLSLKIFSVVLNRQSINLSSHQEKARENRAPFYNIMESSQFDDDVCVCLYTHTNKHIIIETFFK